MQVFNFSKTSNTQAYFYDSVNDRFCRDEKPYGSTSYFSGEWFTKKGQADKKIIIDSHLCAQDIDEILKKVL